MAKHCDGERLASGNKDQLDQNKSLPTVAAASSVRILKK